MKNVYISITMHQALDLKQRSLRRILLKSTSIEMKPISLNICVIIYTINSHETLTTTQSMRYAAGFNQLPAQLSQHASAKLKKE